jgi:HEAT repeat protein
MTINGEKMFHEMEESELINHISEDKLDNADLALAMEALGENAKSIRAISILVFSLCKHPSSIVREAAAYALAWHAEKDYVRKILRDQLPKELRASVRDAIKGALGII